MGVGAAMSVTVSGSSGPGSGFIESVAENGFGMSCRPAIGQHCLQSRIIRVQAHKKFAYVGPWLDLMMLCASQDGG
jgi:hypothetical protein